MVVAAEVADFSESAIFAVPTGILLDSYVGSSHETVAANSGSSSRRSAPYFLCPDLRSNGMLSCSDPVQILEIVADSWFLNQLLFCVWSA